MGSHLGMEIYGELLVLNHGFSPREGDLWRVPCAKSWALTWGRRFMESCLCYDSDLMTVSAVSNRVYIFLIKEISYIIHIYNA